MNSPNKTLVVSHDAGGAAELAAWLKHSLPLDSCDFLLAGPAVSVVPAIVGAVALSTVDFSNIDFNNIDFNNMDFNNYANVLTSTSGAADWERCGIRRARQQRIPVTSMLDHWVHFEERFLLDGQHVYPDNILVVDRYAEAIAGAIPGFPPVERVDNYYLRDQVAAITRLTAARAAEGLDTPDEINVLYVCEPSEGNGYDEFEALENFIGYLCENSAGRDESYRLRLRPHPKEPHDKYAALIERFAGALQIQCSAAQTLCEDCAWSDWVVGCQTKAMVVALAAGKKVYSSLPPGAPPLVLPQRGIVRLFPPL